MVTNETNQETTPHIEAIGDRMTVKERERELNKHVVFAALPGIATALGFLSGTSSSIKSMPKEAAEIIRNHPVFFASIGLFTLLDIGKTIYYNKQVLHSYIKQLEKEKASKSASCSSPSF